MHGTTSTPRCLPFSLWTDIALLSWYRPRLGRRILWHVRHCILFDRPFRPEILKSCAHKFILAYRPFFFEESSKAGRFPIGQVELLKELERVSHTWDSTSIAISINISCNSRILLSSLIISLCRASISASVCFAC